MNQLALFGVVQPPKWRTLIAELRRVNRVHEAPFVIVLNVHGLAVVGGAFGAQTHVYGSEALPGRGASFDAPAAARRLLAALKAGERSDR